MTNEEIGMLFTKFPYGEARNRLIDEIHRMGIQTTGNEEIFELRSMALGGSTKIFDNSNNVVNVVNKIVSKNPTSETEKNELKETEVEGESEFDPNINLEENEKSENDNEDIAEYISEENKNKSVEDKEQEKVEEPYPIEESSPKPERKRKKSNKSSIDKSEEEIRNEAERKIAEAKKLMEIADEMKKMKEEEEKRKEEERRKKEDNVNTDSSILKEVVNRLKTLHKAFLVGPAGSGKTTLAINACKALFNIKGTEKDVVKSNKFAQISFSPDTISSDMLGFTDVNGVFHETDIIRVFRDGGVILFDEIDDADPSILVKLNTMLSNGVIPTPKGMIVQNQDTYIVSTANTYGTGGNSIYVGRNRLDGATLDRWKLSTIYVDYDNKLEKSIIDTLEDQKVRKDLYSVVATIREFISNNKLKYICSTRFVKDAVLMSANGYSIISIVNTFLSDWDENNRRNVINNIKNCLKSVRIDK